MKKHFALLSVIAATACGNSVDGPSALGTPSTGADDQTNSAPAEDVTEEEPVVEVPPKPTQVAMLIMQGHMGRTTVSCDGGRHWLGERSFDEGKYVCWTTGAEYNVECDHHYGAGRGVGGSGGAVIANFGWGTPATFYRSVNGFDWEEVHTFRAGLQGVNPTGDGFIMVSNQSKSTDHGLTWTDGAGENLSGVSIGIVRRSGYLAAYDAYLLIGDDGALVSMDRGTTWWAPETWPTVCHESAVGMGSSDGVAVVPTSTGEICVSHDGMQNWEIVTLETKPSVMIMAEGRYHAWNSTLHMMSDDGVTWTSETLTPSGITIGATAYDPSHKTFASVRGGWSHWYDQQRFYVSEDGTNWTVLDEADAVRGHPARAMTFAWVEPSEQCPLEE